jgi:hypothetical protein
MLTEPLLLPNPDRSFSKTANTETTFPIHAQFAFFKYLWQLHL